MDSEASEVVEAVSIGDQLNLQSIDFISALQDKLEPYESWIVQASVLGDNRQAFTFFFPILTGLNLELGIRTLWAAIMVEWSNLILKWIFQGDRPYWWIGETDLYDDECRPNLRQFPNTCESGPGTPSGHLMMNVALFYVVVRGISSLFIWESKRFSNSIKTGLALLVYAAYATWIGIIFVSRLYIQAHFIQQCVFGVVMGLLVGQFAWKSQWLVKLNMLWSVVFGNALFALSLLTYIGLISNGLDPMRTLPLAMKYCVNPEYVKIDTQPFYIMVRFTGAALGLGLGISSDQFPFLQQCPSHVIRVVLAMKGGVLLGRMATIIQTNIPTDDMILYLTLSLGVNIILPYVIVCILPYFLISVYPPNQPKRR